MNLEAARPSQVDPASTLDTTLEKALRYLDSAPGKRLRPRLLLTAAQATGGEPAVAKADSAAEAIELIHTYSLVHDDLPAMDDDGLRRGRPTLHVAFDEATAILVGDGLQAKAFELIARDETLSTQQRVELIAILADAAGFAGMVGGQSLDMEATGITQSLEELQTMHALKTGALITAAVEMGGVVGDASAQQRATLQTLGQQIGLAFQIIDDVIDVRSDSATLGKTSGKDAASGKSTYVSLMGLDAAEREALRLYESSLALIADWSSDADPLRELLGQMVLRDR